MRDEVLIANRGEIAMRVIRTCRRLGLSPVAIYAADDADAPHVRAADRAHPVRGYLDIDSILEDVGVAVGGRVHPGYGFLSENAGFARAVQEAGLVFVGPSPEVMEEMGRKDAARALAEAAGVPVVPGGENAGFPVLVKAAAGGGGKGMRVVRSADELDEAMAAARREAASAFGDDTMLLEKYVEQGRHIEVQVFGDTHGNVVHLRERDCSVQRRHQKVIEEAPATRIGEDTRDVVLRSAVALARHVGYVGAGTVEFLVDETSGEAYFLEMNTRLQVEHPVTEEVVRVRGERLDLVELQLRVAAGEELGFTQDEVTVDGHAIEARIYAEDAWHGFLPQAGQASIVRWPADDGGIRVDHALESGQVVSTAYDPMLGKVIAHRADRAAATHALREALERTAILGLTTNTGYLAMLLGEPQFERGNIHTAWLDRYPDAWATARSYRDRQARAVAAWAQVYVQTLSAPGPWQTDGWRSGAPAPAVRVELDDWSADVDRSAGLVTTNDENWQLSQLSAGNHTLELLIHGHRTTVVANVQPGFVDVSIEGQRTLFRSTDRLADHTMVTDGSVLAPMPGTVLEVRVAVGDTLAEGDVLGVIEAMKMELSLKAPLAGTVAAVDALVGEQVALGHELFRIEKES